MDRRGAMHLGFNLRELTLRELQAQCVHQKARYFCPCDSDCKSFVMCEKCSKAFCDTGCNGIPSPEEVQMIRNKEAQIKADWRLLRELQIRENPTGLQIVEEYRPEWYYALIAIEEFARLQPRPVAVVDFPVLQPEPVAIDGFPVLQPQPVAIEELPGPQPKPLAIEELPGPQSKPLAIEEFPGLKSKPLDTRDKKTVYSLTALNELGEVNIVPINDQRYLEMLDVCMDADDLEFLTAVPKIGTFVMAKFDTGNQFYRAKVEGLEDDNVKLSFLDLGTSKLVTYTQLKPLVEEAFTHPVFSYQGCLTKGAENHLLILPDLLHSFRSAKIGRNFNLTKENWNGIVREFVLIDVHTGKSLDDEFNELKVWLWERNLRNCTSGIDADLIDKGNWHDMDSSLDSVQVLSIPTGSELVAKYVQDSEQRAVFLVPVSLESYCKNTLCLNAQIQRYCEQVKAAQYYPTLNDVFIYYDGDSYHRCRRISECLTQSLETGDMLPMPNVDENLKFVRRMPPEFLIVPIGIIECDVTGGWEILKMITPEQREIRIRIKSFDEYKMMYTITILGVV